MTLESSAGRSRLSLRKLAPPSLARAREGVIDPAWSRAVVSIKPYPMMACGDELLLYWHGLNNEGEHYRHEVRRFVTQRQVGRSMVFVVREPHIAELDGGSLEISYRVTGKQLPAVLVSQALQLQIGDSAPQLLPLIANDAVGGSLDPGRLAEGTTVTVRPYSNMAAGDRLILLATLDSKPLWRDVLDIEAHAVGNRLSLWIDHADIAPYSGHSLTLSYVVRRGHSVRRAEPLSVWLGPLVRPPLEAPRIPELIEDWLDVEGLQGAATVVIDGVGLEAGELVWLQCNGSYPYVLEREITEATAGQPVVFTVPATYWQAQREQSVRVFYQVERLDEVHQRSADITVQVRARA
ncbi:hypothetical protein UG46_14840 [Pseudomonas fluorescens]|jgi:hypothetical protein|uniref:Uncharacterized protein n=1 Tax=Pseudomonas frederiksbergensis TaxID=104087 RepID=A0A0B1Z7L8_9PSED|nr:MULTISPECIES: hypothetical protein [Pseudomonas]KHK65412.1 hypothetical protein JZ00_05905 [Pseudomonas frederiksbergensis]KJH85731.1 hypothetical protein UG46_14840 [Pseudomonas fluorescens]